MDSSICKVETHGDITILDLRMNDFTGHEERDLMRDFFSLLREGHKKIILDLSRTSYISSIGLSALVSLLKRTKKEDCDLILCGVTDRIQEVLTTTKLSEMFEISPTRDDAVNKLR